MKKMSPDCNGICGFSGFIDAGKTTDGKSLHAVVCSAGRIGGCSGVLAKEQLERISSNIGRTQGVGRRVAPLRFEPDTGVGITHSWREIGAIDKRTGRLIDRFSMGDDSANHWLDIVEI